MESYKLPEREFNIHLRNLSEIQENTDRQPNKLREESMKTQEFNKERNHKIEPNWNLWAELNEQNFFKKVQ